MDTDVGFKNAIYDPTTGTYVEFRGSNGGKVSYDSAHPDGGVAHPNGDPPHIHWSAPKSEGGGKGKLYHDDSSQPGRPSPQETKDQKEAAWMEQQNNDAPPPQ